MPSGGELICMIKADTRLVGMQISMKYGSAGKTKTIRPTLLLFFPHIIPSTPKALVFSECLRRGLLVSLMLVVGLSSPS